MTVGVAVVYLVVVGAAAAWLPGGSDLSTALVVVVIGLGFAPVRAAVQRRVDQLVYGTSADPRRWWSSLGTPDTYDLDALAGALRLGLRLVDVRLLPVDPTGDLPSLEADAHETVLPLVSRGRVVGVLIAAPRPGERLDRRTAGMLEQVAGLAATTLDLLQSNEALEAARSRLVSIRHEERRVLRRDLHDGLGPALAGIRLGLSASRNLRERDPVAAEQMLDELQVELGRRSEDIRQLSRSLLPPALDDGDLRAALESLAARFAKAGLVVGLDVQEGMPIDPRQQIALYHIAGEAMLNVHRHARARRCEVVVDRDDDGGLRLAVIDDGVGLSDGDRPRSHGIGLRSMRERAEEIGGTVDVSRVDDRGGTRVTVHLPASR
jgi:signal transduction histidine kinase